MEDRKVFLTVFYYIIFIVWVATCMKEFQIYNLFVALMAAVLCLAPALWCADATIEGVLDD